MLKLAWTYLTLGIFWRNVLINGCSNGNFSKVLNFGKVQFGVLKALPKSKTAM